MTMDELLEALERAEGPSRELDSAIHAELRFGPWTPDEWAATLADPMCINPSIPEALGYTASIDAALTLVPDGWMVTKIFQFREFDTAAPFGWGCQLNIEGDEARSYYWSEHGDTLAIAICRAALQARRAMELTASLAPRS